MKAPFTPYLFFFSFVWFAEKISPSKRPSCPFHPQSQRFSWINCGSPQVHFESCFILHSQTYRSQGFLQPSHQFWFWSQPVPPSCSTLAQLKSSLIKLPAFSLYARLPCPHSFNRYFTGNEEEERGSGERRRGKGHCVKWALLLPENDRAAFVNNWLLFAGCF